MLLMLVSCYADQPVPKYQMKAAFDESELSWFDKKGENIVSGSSFLRQNNGAVVTCAGQGVSIYPYSDHLQEFIILLYGDKNGGIARPIEEEVVGLSEKVDIFRKTSQCDVNGEFSFEGLADGDYYILTDVSWSTQTRISGNFYLPTKQGGTMSKLVTLSGGEHQKIVVSY